MLATPHALRGYGHAGQWPTVHVADTAADFRRVLRDLMDRPPAAEPPAYAAIRARVTWDRALAALGGTIAALTAAEGAATGPR